jgi:hypothetical protein
MLAETGLRPVSTLVLIRECIVSQNPLTAKGAKGLRKELNSCIIFVFFAYTLCSLR